MPDINLNGTDYPSYVTVAEADTYLAADPSRSALWAARSSDQKKQGVIQATRVLKTLCWTAGTAPSTDEPVDPAIKEATAIMAADILTKPKLASQPGAQGGIKRVKAGEAEVEFFISDSQPLPLPIAAYNVLAAAGLLCGTGADAGGDTAGEITGSGYPSRFRDCREWPPELASYYD